MNVRYVKPICTSAGPASFMKAVHIMIDAKALQNTFLTKKGQISVIITAYQRH